MLESNPELAMVIALRANLSRPTEESNTVLQNAFQAATEAPIEHVASDPSRHLPSAPMGS